MNPVSLDLLRTLKVFLDKGNSVEAAKHLHISQPALSQQLQRLEAGFSQPLFQKSGRSKELTPFGVAFVRHVLDRLTPLERNLALFQNSSGKPEQVCLRIGGRHELFASLTKQLSFPGKLKFRSLPSLTAREELLRGELDIIVTRSLDWDSETFRVFPLKKDAVYLAVSSQWAKAQGSQWHHSDNVTTLPFIAYNDDPPFLNDWCRIRNLKPRAVDVSIICPDWRSLVELVGQNLGFSLVPEQFIKQSGITIHLEPQLHPKGVEIVMPRILDELMPIREWFGLERSHD